ncbi:hypothetical protein TraAM80_09844 [Trypanosoma rangeli]|uniref:Uncharacterized protein n=1 Tax=Trypanosoma rangeli TaxID=5698 RepID=A0A3R7MWD9_TRYRA|nr:uncharacterized protein TraAM80_09844 [Trypanosoma rangeli]RNE96341.1 hypothetical protein TraAM80_09844 [Trypanosoma rangeli]|eukprot:RNE96341.1 hypothetical protein TraAM80_09844 [Trypanosoma rangeli]
MIDSLWLSVLLRCCAGIFMPRLPLVRCEGIFLLGTLRSVFCQFLRFLFIATIITFASAVRAWGRQHAPEWGQIRERGILAYADGLLRFLAALVRRETHFLWWLICEGGPPQLTLTQLAANGQHEAPSSTDNVARFFGLWDGNWFCARHTGRSLRRLPPPFHCRGAADWADDLRVTGTHTAVLA